MYICIFFFNDTATTEIYTLSLHDALPILRRARRGGLCRGGGRCARTRRSRGRAATSPARCHGAAAARSAARSEEHTSELQSRQYLVCRLLLEKKKKQNMITNIHIHQHTHK